MGGAQSTPSRPSSPSFGDTPTRPPPTRRLSSFSRSSRPFTRRKISHIVSPPSTIAPTPRTDVSTPTAVETPSEERDEDEVMQVLKKTEGPMPDVGSWTTPSVATTPGPPVGLTQPQPHPSTSRHSSYFPSRPQLTPSASTSPFAPTPFPTSVAGPSIPPVPIAPSASAAAGPSNASEAAAPTPFRPAHYRYMSLPNPASAADRTMSGTLTAMLGISGTADPADDPSDPLPRASPSLPTGADAPPSPTVSDLLRAAATIIDAEEEAGTEERDGEVDDIWESATAGTAGTDEEAVAARSAARRAELDQLRARLDDAREDLERSRAELDELRERRRVQQEARSRVPVGAMLVIQGLAQTRITSSTLGEVQAGGSAAPGGAAGASIPEAGQGISSAPAGSPAAAGPAPRRPNMGRRISDGSLFMRRREIEREQGASLDQQARMISGLLTVAAAATANTLLAVPEPTPEPASAPRTGLTGAIHSLLNRLRPARAPQHGIEQALGQYLRNAVRERRPTAPAVPGATAPEAETNGLSRLALPPVTVPESQGGAAAGSEFQAFLRGLEGDLVGAVRAYAGSMRSDDGVAELREMRAADTVQEETPAEAAGDPVPDPVTSQGAAPEQEEQEVESGETTGEDDGDSTWSSDSEVEVEAESDSDSTTEPTTSAIPVFHAQLGQNTPGGQADRYGVSGGTDGQPRQLNFFRAHLFPPISFGPAVASPAVGSSGTSTNAEAGPSGTRGSSATATAPTPDPNAIVPCIFVGVRSIQRDESGGPEDIFNQPGLFEGQGEEGAGAAPGSPSTSAPAPTAPSVPADSNRPSLPRVVSSPAPDPSPPRSFRDRFLSRLSRRPALAPVHPINTYLVYVIGGNYPANHPVLRIPALLSGAPLSDEDMALISELIGPAKAPTASKEDIERAGLKIVDGAQMAELGEKGEVLDNCTERCLICLGDYEEGEECRVLVCRHGYHKACVDQWLEKGSNSCPACRSEAVNTKSAPTMDAAAAGGGADETLPPLSPPIPVMSVPAGGRDSRSTRLPYTEEDLD